MHPILPHTPASCAAITAIALALPQLASTARGAESIQSPDGRVSVTFELREGRPGWAVALRGAPVLQHGALGIETAPARAQGRYRLLGAARSAGDRNWRPVWGNHSEVRDRYRELTLSLEEIEPPHRPMHLVFRAYNEGVALRYAVPAATKAAPGRLTLSRRLTEYNFGGNRPVHQCRNFAYGTAGIDTMLRSEGSVTIDLGGGRFAALTDADRSDFPQTSWERKKTAPGTIIGALHSPATGEPPFHTSWEVLILGETAGQLYENRHLIENLCPPCALADTSWIRPGEAICQVRNTRLVTAELKKLLAFASARRIEYVEIDHSWCGAETKWTPAETDFFGKHKSRFWDGKPEWRDNIGGNPMAPAKGWVPFRPKADSGGNYVDLDVPALAACGRSLDPPVGICLYLRGAVLREFGGEHAIDDVLAVYERWGVAGIKPGFVPAGSQQHERTIAHLLERAAAHRLIVNIHDAYQPCGLSRTYPNLVNVEGVAGDEAEPSIPAAMKSRHDVMLPFTRCLMGPVDYTPEMFKPSKTHAHQVAMLGVYHGRPSIRGGMRQWSPGGEGGGEIEFIEKLPGLFDEMRVFTELGRHVTVARRRGAEWFVASLGDGEARRFDLSLDFLAPGRSYRAVIHADTPGQRKTTASRIAVTSKTVLPVALEPNGGHLMILEPAER